MNVDLFTYPEKHPFGMLEGYTNASEKESVLAWILQKCVIANAWITIRTKHTHPTMVRDGLLTLNGQQSYDLTEKSKGLLYTQFHK